MEKTTMSVQELSSQMGISLPKAYELVKMPGVPVHPHRDEDPHSHRGIPGVAGHCF